MNGYIYELDGKSYLVQDGLFLPISTTAKGARYVSKNGMLYPLSNAPQGRMAGGMIFPAPNMGRPIRPAGQAGYQVGTTIAPPGAVGTDANSYYVDANHNVLDWNGHIVGPPGSSSAAAATSNDPPNTTIGGTAPLPAIPGGTAGPPASSSFPSMMSLTGPQKSKTTVIATVVVGVAVIGGLVYYFGRGSRAAVTERSPRLRSARARSSRG